MDIKEMTTEELRQLKKDISDELSRRHKAKEDEKCSCWTCHHCFYDKNAHPSYKNPDFRGGYRCLAWGDKGRNISTKYKAPAWCPVKKGE